ncbi:MAG: ABC transporter permease subunit [Chloroflexi bacterium]|nr:ABC transporter permease subunit [Chloroflexota bacterium]
MITALSLERFKTRRKWVWWVVAALVAAQAAWSLWSLTYLDAEDLPQGWLFLLYDFPLLNALMMPVIVAVVASRLSDLEHKGQTLRLLDTLMSAGRLYDAKFLHGALYMLAAVFLQVALMLIAGLWKGFPGQIPLDRFAAYVLMTMAVDLLILAVQQALSLWFTNQMIPLAVGVMGAFYGLFSLFFPSGLQGLLPWGLYGVLMFVRLDWDQATRISNYSWTPLNWGGLVLVAVEFCVIYAIGRFLFARKEQ